MPAGQVSILDNYQHVGWVERTQHIRANKLKDDQPTKTHCSVSVSETQLQTYLTMSPIGTVVGVGFLLVFLRRPYFRKGRSVYVMVNFRITYTLSIHNQPPKSPNPLNPPCQGDLGNSGGLHEAAIRGTIGERLHIYIVHHNTVWLWGSVQPNLRKIV